MKKPVNDEVYKHQEENNYSRINQGNKKVIQTDMQVTDRYNQKRLIETAIPYLYLIPALLFVGIFLLYPAVRTFCMAFTRWNGVSPPVWVGLKSFRTIFLNPVFRTSLINTLYWAVATLILPVVLGLIAALFVSRIKSNNIFKLLLFLPYSLSAVVVGIVWSYMYQSSGAINTFLRLIGLERLTYIWLQEVPQNTFAIIIAFTWRMVGINFVLFLIGLQNIPQEPIEAAKLEGASEWQLTIKVILPMLSQMTAVVVVMAFINGFNSFDIIWVMTLGGPFRSTETLAVTMYRESFIHFKFGSGSSVAVLISLITFGASIFYFKTIFREEHFE